MADSGTLVSVLRAAGEGTRLRLLSLLNDGEHSVKDLTEILGQSQPRVSRHLKLLADAGLVTRNAEGRVIAGSLNDAVETCDLWTFSRSVQSASPDWLVDETDEG